MQDLLLCYDDERSWELARAAALQQAMQQAVALTIMEIPGLP